MSGENNTALFKNQSYKHNQAKALRLAIDLT